jgi:uncharacterized membrane protein
MSTIPRNDSHEEFELEQRLGTLLRAGVILSAMVTLVGGIMYLFVHGHDLTDHRIFHGEPAALRTVSGVVSGVLNGDSRAIIQLGVLLLIATPVARVAMALAGFARERDWVYVAVSLLVLAILCWSLVHGG